MKTIYVVGGNGFAKECYNYIRILSEKKHEIQFGGFLGHNGYVVDFFDLNGFFKGDVADYVFVDGEYAVIGAGYPELRYKIYCDLKQRGIPLYNLIADGCELNPYVEMGEGNVFAPPFLASVHMKIGNGNVFNGGVNVGHDDVIGNFNFFAPRSQILGSVQIGDFNSFGANAILLPHAKIGNNNVISPLSCVYRGCKNNARMHGNPAVKIGEVETIIERIF